MLRKSLTAIALIAMMQPAAAEIIAEWTDTGAANPDFTFHLDLQPTGLADTFTLHGYAVYAGSGNREALLGSATYSSGENFYVVSLFFNSSTGETFTVGANLDPATLSGAGTLIRVAHGGVGADRDGTLTVVP